MSSSVSNKVHGDKLVGDGAVGKLPANNGAVAKSPANDEAVAANDPTDDDESATADTQLLPIKDGDGGGGGGSVSVPVTIEVTATRIDFDQWRSQKVGFLRIDAGVPEMKSPDSDTVLRDIAFADSFE